MADSKDEFGKIRLLIDAADAALVEALETRARAMQQFVELKKRDPEAYFAMPRDTDVIGRARESMKSFPSVAIEPVIREVLSACQSMVAPPVVAFAGPEGGFAHVASRKYFGVSAVHRAMEQIPEVLEDVVRDRASFGVVPLETSTDGAVTATLHGLAQSDVKIGAEITIPASYHLLSKTGNSTDVEKVFATPAANAACEKFLRTHFPKATVMDVRTATVAAELVREDHGAAAVGTDILAELHQLRYVRERIEDLSGVETRYAIVGKTLPQRTGSDRTVIALAVHDQPGALYRALQPFADRGINLTRLESRPARSTAWRYIFFVEMDGHITDRPVLTAIEELRGASRHVKILGSYPRPAS